MLTFKSDHRSCEGMTLKESRLWECAVCRTIHEEQLNAFPLLRKSRCSTRKPNNIIIYTYCLSQDNLFRSSSKADHLEHRSASIGDIPMDVISWDNLQESKLIHLR